MISTHADHRPPPGNLVATVLANGTVTFHRESDSVELLSTVAAFDASTSTEPGYWHIDLDVATTTPSLVYGLGQIEGTTSQGGCPVSGKQVMPRLTILLMCIGVVLCETLHSYFRNVWDV